MSVTVQVHTVKEQHAPEVHREIALLNTDNEFNREINEEDIDFNIPGPPHSTVKQLYTSHTHGSTSERISQSSSFHPCAHLFDSTSPLSTSTSSSCLSQSSSSTSSCSLSSSTRRAWQTFAAPLQKSVRIPLLHTTFVHVDHVTLDVSCRQVP